MELPKRFCANRLTVTGAGDGQLVFRDRLEPRVTRELPAAGFATLKGAELDRELLRRGFMRGTLPAALRRIADAPRHEGDLHYWQFPARTEAAAFEAHRGIEAAHLEGTRVHVYLGLPWATWIDYQGTHRHLPQGVELEFAMQRVRIRGLRRAWSELGYELRVHTVCQHIHWRRFVRVFACMGVTDLWLSHAPAPGQEGKVGGMSLHPWHLYAVNVEDPARRRGLTPGKDPEARSILASFIGAHERHYLTDVRLRLRELAAAEGFLIEVNDRWHYHHVVYGHQMRGTPLEASYRIDDSVERYNRILSDSRFSLCPPGTGANTLRLWESLAVGAVPVVFEPLPRTLVDDSTGQVTQAWHDAVISADGGLLQDLPSRLASIPVEEVRRRADLGRRYYEATRGRRCF